MWAKYLIIGCFDVRLCIVRSTTTEKGKKRKGKKQTTECEKQQLTLGQFTGVADLSNFFTYSFIHSFRPRPHVSGEFDSESGKKINPLSRVEKINLQGIR